MNEEVLFVSRAGRDAELSERVGRILESAGYRVILQQHSFTNKSFIAQMHASLQGGARVIALLSPAYLNSDYCAAEWQSVLADDPLNRRSRLIVLRVAECAPPGLLKALAYWDLVAAADSDFERIVLEAVRATPSACEDVDGRRPQAASAQPIHNLPAQLTAFIGRATVVGEIKAEIESVRLVTILGAGGIGKTRTALEVAAQLLDGSGDGVWFVDFAPLGNAAYVVTELASVFDVREETGKPLLESVLAYLKAKRLLLIFDNCEHVVAEARRVAEAVLRVCPQVRILATSRESLAATGEAIYKLPTLRVPRAATRLSLEDALQYEAIALFGARAQAVEKRFALTDANVATVADICRRLDGIALAIELAAPRLKILSLAELDRKLDERFRLLTGGSKTALPRQQTMQALIDWSYDLLDERERQLFRRLSIFGGGWTLEAAAVVCGGDDDDEFTVLDTLTSLSDKSLVAVEFGAESRRFRLLESMRAYALARIREAGEEAPLARRHADFFGAFGGDGSAQVLFDGARLEAIEAELENIRETLTWALEKNQDNLLGGRLAFALGRFWSIRHPSEGRRWLQLARDALAGTSDLALAAKLATAKAAMLPHGSSERFEATVEALAAVRNAHDSSILARALCAYGEQLAPLERRVEAKAAFEEALEQARSLGHEWDAARALAGLGSLAVEAGDLAAARTICNEALDSFERLESIDGVAYVSITLAEAEFAGGNVQAALTLGRRARSAHGKLQNNWSCACASDYLAAFSLVANQIEDARLHARDAIALLEGERHPLFLADAVAHLGLVATLSGDPERGAMLLGYAERAIGKSAHNRGRPAQVCHDRHLALLKEALGPQRLSQHLAQSAQFDEERIVAEALSV